MGSGNYILFDLQNEGVGGKTGYITDQQTDTHIVAKYGYEFPGGLVCCKQPNGPHYIYGKLIISNPNWDIHIKKRNSYPYIGDCPISRSTLH